MMMKELYKLSLTVFALLLCTSLALAQERTVSGTVSDETGQGLPGVNVLLKGTSQGTVTDASGAITDVTVSYPMDLKKQMLEYSGAK